MYGPRYLRRGRLRVDTEEGGCGICVLAALRWVRGVLYVLVFEMVDFCSSQREFATKTCPKRRFWPPYHSHLAAACWLRAGASP